MHIEGLGLCVRIVVSPEAEDNFLSCIKASKNNKGNSSCAAPFARSKFQLLFPSEQLCGVAIITIINKCSLLI